MQPSGERKTYHRPFVALAAMPSNPRPARAKSLSRKNLTTGLDLVKLSLRNHRNNYGLGLLNPIE